MSFKDLLRNVQNRLSRAPGAAPPWMRGRYGVDQLGRAASAASLVCLLLGFVPRLRFFFYVGVALLLVSYWRMFSKNVARRSQENMKYLAFRNRVTWWWESRKKRAAGQKTHHYYSCPSCRQEMRVPRGKGRVRITCPNCRTQFEKRV